MGCTRPLYFGKVWKEFTISLKCLLSAGKVGAMKHPFPGFHKGTMTNRVWPVLIGDWLTTCNPLTIREAECVAILIDKMGFPAYLPSMTCVIKDEFDGTIKHLSRRLEKTKKGVSSLMDCYLNTLATMPLVFQNKLSNDLDVAKQKISHYFEITHFSLTSKADSLNSQSKGGKGMACVKDLIKYLYLEGKDAPFEGEKTFNHVYFYDKDLHPNSRSIDQKGKIIKFIKISDQLSFQLYTTALDAAVREGHIKSASLTSKERFFVLTDKLPRVQAVFIFENGFKNRIATTRRYYASVLTQVLQVPIGRLIKLLPEIQDMDGNIQTNLANRLVSKKPFTYCYVSDLTDASNMLNQHYLLDALWSILIWAGVHTDIVYRLAFEWIKKPSVVLINDKYRGVVKINPLLRKFDKYTMDETEFGFIQSSGLLMGSQLTRELLLIHMYALFESVNRFLGLKRELSFYSSLGDDFLIFTEDHNIRDAIESLIRLTDGETKEEKTTYIDKCSLYKFFIYGKRLYRSSWVPTEKPWNQLEDHSFLNDVFPTSVLAPCAKNPFKVGSELGQLLRLSNYERYQLERVETKTISCHKTSDFLKKRRDYYIPRFQQLILPRLTGFDHFEKMPQSLGGSGLWTSYLPLVDKPKVSDYPPCYRMMVYLHYTSPVDVIWTTLLFNSMVRPFDSRDNLAGEVFSFYLSCIHDEQIKLLLEKPIMQGNEVLIDYKDSSWITEYCEQSKEIKSLKRNGFVSISQYLAKMEKTAGFINLVSGACSTKVGQKGRKPRKDPFFLLIQALRVVPVEIYQRLVNTDLLKSDEFFTKLIEQNFLAKRQYLYLDASKLDHFNLDLRRSRWNLVFTGEGDVNPVLDECLYLNTELGLRTGSELTVGVSDTEFKTSSRKSGQETLRFYGDIDDKLVNHTDMYCRVFARLTDD